MYKLHPWIASNGAEIECYDVTYRYRLWGW